MFFTRSLRARTLLYVLIPTALGLLAVATVALYAYERVAQTIVPQVSQLDKSADFYLGHFGDFGAGRDTERTRAS